ncbi:hypothetical protein CQW23_06507 [Capsicum baccatum]|uniref:Uncharacterized protein n=1 Tax=Capsicum baccatum TaxID=33114 RepID=A0A2G2X3H7_CAPBA|nr:hypothetical protein CQW23_06507 [Capsicum baccatum]
MNPLPQGGSATARGIRKLLNLQTFIVQGSVHSFIKFPELTWEIKQLRHLKLRSFYLPDPPSSSIDGERNLVWSNIQPVSGLLPYCCPKKVLSRIQNIKKLCIRGHVYDYPMHEEVMDFREIVDLPQLETLSITVDCYHVSHWSSRSHKLTVCVPSATQFPTKLKKLKLVGTRLAWEDLNIIGHWPNLEVLKLKPNACRGLEWRPIEGGFRMLRFLLIEATEKGRCPICRIPALSCRVSIQLPIKQEEARLLTGTGYRFSFNVCRSKKEKKQ